MSTRRDFLRNTAAAGVLAATSGGMSQGAENAGNKERSTTRSKKIAHGWISRIRSLIRREETVFHYNIHGDNWHMSWASDDQQYVGLCDGGGPLDQPHAHYNSRMLTISGGPRDAEFHDLASYPMLGAPTQKPQDPRYYSFGTLAHDGYLYQFMSTFNRSFRHTDGSDKAELNDLLRFNGVKLIYSPDNGLTWHNQDRSTPVVWESWNSRSRDTMVFFEEDQEAFSLLTVLQMGKNYGQNQDGYVYVYAPNGNAIGTMNELVMFRVPKGNILDRESYEYFAGRRGDGRANWTKDIKARAVVHTFPRGWVNYLVHPYAWHPSVVYNAPLGLYLMTNWGMGSTPDGMWFGKPSYLGFWVAPDPWGPWAQIHEETAWLPGGDTKARAYQPQIAPKWIAADGKSFWLVWTDFQLKDGETYARFNAEVTEKYRRNEMGLDDWVRLVAMQRKHKPYYAFNVQRVDLIVE